MSAGLRGRNREELGMSALLRMPARSGAGA